VKYITTVGEQQFEIEVISPNQVTVNGKPLDVDFLSVSGQPVYSLLVDGASYQAHVFPGEEGALQVLLRGALYTASVEDEREKRLKAAGSASSTQTGEFTLRAPMPGLIVKVPVAEGDEINKGEVLVILESMKMQNELKSPRDGKVIRVLVRAGDSVEQRQSIVSVE
jgi:biotin carboxyl carrier protein